MADNDLLISWRTLPHVREWWGEPEPLTEDDLGDPRVARWITEIDGEPFGFIQDYAVHGRANHHFASLPKGSRGVDQYIGKPEFLGQGHGQGMIRARMEELFSKNTPFIATDPHPDNARAIAVYRKLGFQIVGTPVKTKWGMILPMHASR